ncbi:sensor histidine kinase [Olivibacter sp. XZL3]|uniref:sensor histidine kinase n=1 Tax=Olivibacter sp. XZL3 TaxID=1735116 RepID=UPI0014170057|nr:histidine kinase [Olivibacter sp. XZL3]
MEKEKLEVENDKVLAEHAFLRAQINPHFLHNTLSFLYAKSLTSCPDVADAILLLDDIMRYAMENKQDDKSGVLITREIEQIKKLIQIYQLRYAGRLFIDISIEGNLTARRIIPLVLITLVENAFKHGDLENPIHPIQIKAAAEGKVFQFVVRNRKRDGPKEISHGIGLDNLKKRLTQAYGDSFHLEIKNEEYSHEANLEIRNI